MATLTAPEFCLQAQWPAPANVRAFTTLRSGPGVSLPPFDLFNLGLRCGDEPMHAQQNRDRLSSEFGLPAAPRWLHQVHGVDVVRLRKLSGTEPGLEPIADAAVSSDAGVVIAILTADCLPVLLCSEQGDEVAAAHAGWRGLAAGVLENTVRAMYCPPQEIIAWLGPAAGPDAYEVGAEVREAFLVHDPDAAWAFVATRENHWCVDLYLLARQRLKAAGVTRVFGGGLSTITDRARFYSHRREQITGRMATVIWRNDER